jgi:hypothetical protein
MKSPVEAICDGRYTAVRNSGVRKPDDVIWIVLHSTEGGTAESVARYFTSDTAGGSAHLVVDDDSCFRCLRNIDIPWGAPGANTNGFHIEQCGFARWTMAEWKKHDLMLRRAAYKTALHAKHFGIPLRWVDATGLRRNQPGITPHSDCSKAFGGSDHWDPGAGYPKALFLRYAKEYAKALGSV